MVKLMPSLGFLLHTQLYITCFEVAASRLTSARPPSRHCVPTLLIASSHLPPCRRVIEIFTWKGVAAINLALVMYGLVLVGFTSAMGVIQLVKLRQEASGLFPECFSCEKYVKG